MSEKNRTGHFLEILIPQRAEKDGGKKGEGEGRGNE